jgi:CRP-like cAMP-binding protein
MARRLIASLRRFGAFSDPEADAVEALVNGWRDVAPGDDLAIEGGPALPLRVLMGGQAFRYRVLPDGRRQILGFLIPGDIIDLQSLFLTLDHSIATLTPCEVGLVPRARLTDLIHSMPPVAQALWRASLADAAITREWLVGMGRRSAYGRVAHLFCEMFLRLKSVGLANHDRCAFPVTQLHLSDALGLSAVHTNRTLQALRVDNLIAFQGGELRVLDWAGLQAAGKFDPAYLHLKDAAA